MRLSKFGLRGKARMRMLHQLVGELALRGRLVLSFPKAKNVKRLFLKFQKMEERGAYDRLKSLLRITSRSLRSYENPLPLLTGKKVFSKAFKLRVNDSTRLMELKAVRRDLTV